MIIRKDACLSQVHDKGRRLKKSMEAKIKEDRGVDEDAEAVL